MITLNDSRWFIVDSCGWVEYFGDGPKAAHFAPYLEAPESLLMPTIIAFEVFKKLLRERGQNLAEQFLSQALGFYEREIPLEVRLAANAARLSIETHLPMADAIIYATAQTHHAQLVTSDTHFSGLPGVTLL